jgi:trehalose 6-phosphate synthase
MTALGNKLKGYMRKELNDNNLIIVSNRGPYMHTKQENNIECSVPAGGLVTDLDPVLKACGELWFD